MIELQETQNEKALVLLDAWIADDSGYDERVWPKLKEAISGLISVMIRLLLMN